MRRAIVAAMSVALAFTPIGVHAQSRQSVEALESWIAAVDSHQPGKPDAAAGIVAALTYSDRGILNPAMTIFLAAVRGNSMSVKSDEHQKILEIYHEIRSNPGLAAFLERAAVLHADAAIFRDRFPEFVDDAPPPPNIVLPGGRRAGDSSPLLANERVVLHTDGRVVGEASLNWNWTFARSLLDLLMAPAGRGRDAKHSDISTPADIAFVAEWYHATAAYMLAAGKHAELKTHLIHAAAVLPEDTHVLFDRACFAETLGLPLYQVLANDAYWDARTHISSGVPSEGETDAQAERLFRRTIEIDPAYAEARVRLARLLERRGAHDEAAAQIEQALAGSPPPSVEFFAHLVGGWIAQDRGDAKRSFDQYVAAGSLFPEAQSALLGASQAAAMRGDIATARSFVQKLSDRTAAVDADPWWIYHLGPGRDVDSLMAALWAKIVHRRN
jgi:tetratricopeptide (TPR) repeat protein